MTLAAEIPACRLYLTLCEGAAQRAPYEGPGALWLGRLDPPPPELPNFCRITVGRWYAPTSAAAAATLENDGTKKLRIDVDTRFLSQLRHALLREPGDVLPVALEPPGG